MLYIFYNTDVRIINILKNILSFTDKVMRGKSLKDIEQFNPDKVICYQNKEVIDYCLQKKRCCVNITTKLIRKEEKNLLQFYYKPFSIEEINHKTNYTFSMLDETCSEIIRMLKIKKEGDFKLFNKDSVHAQTVLDYFKTSRKLHPCDIPKTDVPGEEFNTKSIKEYFQEDYNWKINIYIPTYYRFEKTKKSVEKILQACKDCKYDVKVYIGDNMTKEEEMREWLKGLDCDVYFSDQNLGKSGIVNYLHKNKARKSDFIFSIDSDMYPYDEKKNFIEEMIFCLTRCQNVGLVSSNQKECSQHWWDKTVFPEKWEGVELGISENGVGIAGGCIVMKTEEWEKVGMYKENHDIYTGDDGILTMNVIKKLGKQPVIMKNCFMIHEFPREEEKEYTQWKMESWKRDNTQFLKDGFVGENKKGFYD